LYLKKKEMMKISLFSLFSKYKCLVYTAVGSENYLRICNKLQAKGISYRTKTYNNMNYSTGYLPRLDNTQYDIYVTYEDEYKALQAIQGR